MNKLCLGFIIIPPFGSTKYLHRCSLLSNELGPAGTRRRTHVDRSAGGPAPVASPWDPAAKSPLITGHLASTISLHCTWKGSDFKISSLEKCWKSESVERLWKIPPSLSLNALSPRRSSPAEESCRQLRSPAHSTRSWIVVHISPQRADCRAVRYSVHALITRGSYLAPPIYLPACTIL